MFSNVVSGLVRQFNSLVDEYNLPCDYKIDGTGSDHFTTNILIQEKLGPVTPEEAPKKKRKRPPSKPKSEQAKKPKKAPKKKQDSKHYMGGKIKPSMVGSVCDEIPPEINFDSFPPAFYEDPPMSPLGTFTDH